MNSFIVKKKPKSYNGWRKATSARKEHYKTAITQSFQQFHPTHQLLNGTLYGIVYYFHKSSTQTDADNLSKPIWDCLSGFLYDDDKQIKLRIAQSVNIAQNDINLFDLTGVQGIVLADLLESLENEEHIMYIECGYLNKPYFIFNLDNDENSKTISS